MGQPQAFLIKDLDFANVVSLEPADIPTEVKQHLKVCRIRSGESVLFLNGQGQRATGLCHNSEDFSFEIKNCQSNPPPEPIIDLFVSPPKGSAVRDLVHMAGECGVNRLVFFRSDFTQYSKQENLNIPKLEKVAESALEQSTSPWLMEIIEKMDGLHSQLEQAIHPVVADETLNAESIKIPSFRNHFSLFVGPEGGWSPEESKLFKDLPRIALSPNVLRVPTAVVAACTILRASKN